VFTAAKLIVSGPAVDMKFAGRNGSGVVKSGATFVQPGCCWNAAVAMSRKWLVVEVVERLCGSMYVFAVDVRLWPASRSSRSALLKSSTNWTEPSAFE